MPTQKKKISSRRRQAARKWLGRNVDYRHLLIAAVLIITAAAAVYFLMQKDITREGREYLASLDSQNVDAVNDTLKQKRNEERARLLEEGQIDVTAAFDSTAILGDSRANGFKFYNILDSSKVLAEIGYNIKNISDYLDTIEQTKPEKIVFLYGVNEMDNDFDNSQGGFTALFEKQVDEVLKRDPDAHIYIGSIIDAAPELKASNPLYQKADEWNEQLYELCQRRGWTYIDNSEVYIQPEDYEGDGIHFKASFYPRWENLIAEYLWED